MRGLSKQKVCIASVDPKIVFKQMKGQLQICFAG